LGYGCTTQLRDVVRFLESPSAFVTEAIPIANKRIASALPAIHRIVATTGITKTAALEILGNTPGLNRGDSLFERFF